MLLSKTLTFYKRKDVQNAIIEQAKDKEIAIRFRDYFGKRPDILMYENDILELAKKKATSFHCSEELWKNPLSLRTNMKKQEIDELRKGWDLILDIDCHHFIYSKLAAHYLVKILRDQGIKSISAKFSVTGDTPVLCKIKDNIKLIPIKECTEKFKKGLDIRVLSLDKNYKICFDKIVDYIEHKKEIMEVFHKNNKFPLKMSPDHSVYVYREESIKEIPSENITTNDFLISFNKVSLQKPLKMIDVSYTWRNKEYTESIEINNKLLRLIGYYVAEGHLVNKVYYSKKGEKNHVSQIGFSFHIKEKEYQKEVIDLILQLGVQEPDALARKQETPRIINKPEVNTTQILFQSKKWCAFFQEQFGKGAKNKKIPYWFFRLSKQQFLEFLTTYINGDGHKGKYNYFIKTVSKELVASLVWLCNIHNINCSLNWEKIPERKMPEGNICRESLAHILIIPISELDVTLKKKCAPSTTKELLPTKGLKTIYKQCKPKQFVKNRVLQSMLKKQSTNRDYIKRIISWFNETKSVEFDKKSKEILKHYEKLLSSNLSFHKVKRVKKTSKKNMVYDVTVSGSANFFGGYYPILLHNSGNKGFHIAVPFEAFPAEVNGEPTKNLFPEAPRRIAYYLKDKLRPILEKGIMKVEKNNIDNVSKRTGIPAKDLLKKPNTNDSALYNLKEPSLDVEAFLEIDTILIAPRHLYRMPYSFHEKSGLVSVPVETDKILKFQKKMAEPENVKFDIPFLERKNSDSAEGTTLIINSFDFYPKEESKKVQKEYKLPEEAIREELFPPCIKLMLQGMQDGKKRTLFTLTNFLKGAGWSIDAIESKAYEWNQKNPEKLREVILQGQLKQAKKQKEIVPPHNCKRYYQDLGVCQPDSFCSRIKNPLQYAKLKAEKEKPGKGGRQKLTEEQKEMRRKYREKKKKSSG